MVNTYLNWSSLVGIALAVAGAGLYFLRSLRPKLARDYDIFFAAVALLCGGILFFQGWRQDPILQFGQFLLAGSAIFFAFESIRLRGIATEQARRNTPIVDDERPVSRSYRTYEAELEELNPYDERVAPRRIQGARDARPSRDEYDEEARPRRSSNRRSGDDRLGPGEQRSRRKSRPRTEEGPAGYPNDYSEPRDDAPEARDDRPTRRSGTSSRSGNPSPGSTRSRRPRPNQPTAESPRDRASDTEPSSSEYVDYRPVDKDEEDNWGDY